LVVVVVLLVAAKLEVAKGRKELVLPSTWRG
jgi:hypothetical protein